MDIKPVAHIKNDYKNKFAIPRQSGIAENVCSEIIFEKEFDDENAIREIEGFSHLWLIWGFSENVREAHSLTVRPPRLGGNKRVGVFATRSPFRPNNLGLSSVKLVEVRGTRLIVSGADLLDGTPIYDIKPYIKFTDCHEDAVCGFVDDNDFALMNVIDNGLLNEIPQAEEIKAMLENNPRPAYHNDESRIYGFKFAKYEIKFKVNENNLIIVSVENE